MRLEAQKARSMVRKKPVASTQITRGMRQPKRMTKKVSTVVISMSVVTATPYALASALEVRNISTANTMAANSSQLTSGM